MLVYQFVIWLIEGEIGPFVFLLPPSFDGVIVACKAWIVHTIIYHPVKLGCYKAHKSRDKK